MYKIHTYFFSINPFDLNGFFCCSQSSPENNNTRQRTPVSTSHVKLEDNAVFLIPEDETFHARDNYGLEFDFDIDDSTSLDRGSVSSTGTPVLPDLSSASSFEDLPLDFSSDASGLQARDSFRTSSKLSQGSFIALRRVAMTTF